MNGEGNGNSLQYSWLESPMDRRVWQATVHGVAKSWTPLTNTHSEHELCPLSLNITQFIGLTKGGIRQIPSMRMTAWLWSQHELIMLLVLRILLCIHAFLLVWKVLQKSFWMWAFPHAPECVYWCFVGLWGKHLLLGGASVALCELKLPTEAKGRSLSGGGHRNLVGFLLK